MHCKHWARVGVPVALLWACGDDATGVSAAQYTYEGSCTKAACADRERPDTDCTDTAPLFKCSDRGGACAWSYTCPAKDDPNAAVSFAPCDEAACGAKPATAEEAGCAAGAVLTGATCGKLNGAKACAWQPGCAVLGEPIHVDPARIGAECGLDTDAGPCPAGAECVTLPLETGVTGAHCIEDPCGVLSCPHECVTLDSYPGQVVCADGI